MNNVPFARLKITEVKTVDIRCAGGSLGYGFSLNWIALLRQGEM